MAGNIQKLSLAQLRNYYETYREKVTIISQNLNDIRSEMFALELHWTGRRMNSIIEKYNSELVGKVVPIYRFFAGNISGILQEICEQYESMENEGKPIDVSHTLMDYPAVHIEGIDLTPTENVKFEQEAVLAEAKNVTTNLASLSSNIETVITILDDLSGFSDSLNKLVTSYHAQADSFVATVKGVQETLSAAVDDAVKVVQTTESYNDADASRVQAGDNAE